MFRPNIWFFYRVVALALGVFAFSQAVHADTNFGPVAGLICGALGFLFMLFVVNKNSAISEKIFLLTSPCWPAAKYPQASWFTFGAVLFLSAAVNLMISLDNPAAVSLYVGFLLLSLGFLAGSIVAHYQVKNRHH
jgi:hypothetical protein